MRKSTLFETLAEAQEAIVFFENAAYDLLINDPAYFTIYEEMRRTWNIDYRILFANAIEWSVEVSYRSSTNECCIYVCFREEDEVEYTEFFVRGEHYKRLMRAIEKRWRLKKAKAQKTP